ncbi:S4 domain-containing protein [Tsuneonella sp. HG222]
MRLDKLLYCLRFAKTRGIAQRWIAEGHIRRNGERVVRQDQRVAPGDILVLPLKSKVLPIEITALPLRRGPLQEAQACYRALDAGRAFAIGGNQSTPEGPTEQ